MGRAGTADAARERSYSPGTSTKERRTPQSGPFAASGSELPKEEQDYQNDNNKADDSAGSVPPAPAVPPRWQHAQQSQDENDKKDGADTHL